MEDGQGYSGYRRVVCNLCGVQVTRSVISRHQQTEKCRRRQQAWLAANPLTAGATLEAAPPIETGRKRKYGEQSAASQERNIIQAAADDAASGEENRAEEFVTGVEDISRGRSPQDAEDPSIGRVENTHHGLQGDADIVTAVDEAENEVLHDDIGIDGLLEGQKEEGEEEEGDVMEIEGDIDCEVDDNGIQGLLEGEEEEGEVVEVQKDIDSQVSDQADETETELSTQVTVADERAQEVEGEDDLGETVIGDDEVALEVNSEDGKGRVGDVHETDEPFGFGGSIEVGGDKNNAQAEESEETSAADGGALIDKSDQGKTPKTAILVETGSKRRREQADATPRHQDHKKHRIHAQRPSSASPTSYHSDADDHASLNNDEDKSPLKDNKKSRDTVRGPNHKASNRRKGGKEDTFFAQFPIAKECSKVEIPISYPYWRFVLKITRHLQSANGLTLHENCRRIRACDVLGEQKPLVIVVVTTILERCDFLVQDEESYEVFTNHIKKVLCRRKKAKKQSDITVKFQLSHFGYETAKCFDQYEAKQKSTDEEEDEEEEENTGQAGEKVKDEEDGELSDDERWRWPYPDKPFVTPWRRGFFATRREPEPPELSLGFLLGHPSDNQRIWKSIPALPAWSWST